MELCKFCKHMKDEFGIECEIRVLAHTQANTLGVEVNIVACNGFERHRAFVEEYENDEYETSEVF